MSEQAYTSANMLLTQLRLTVPNLVDPEVMTSEDFLVHAQRVRELFVELDKLLSNGGQFPAVWVVPAKPNITSTPARCGHPRMNQGPFCTSLVCANSYLHVPAPARRN